jgi:hypothetical protein
MVQNEGTGLSIQGCRDWRDYRVETTLRPATSQRVGLAARVQGMRRWYGLMLRGDCTAALVKSLDGETVLASKPHAWEAYREHVIALEVVGHRIRGWVQGEELYDVTDADRPLDGRAVAMVVEEGKLALGPVKITPLGLGSRPARSLRKTCNTGVSPVPLPGIRHGRTPVLPDWSQAPGAVVSGGTCFKSGRVR